MKSALTVLLALLPAAAWAHPGHLGPFEGHSHWTAAVVVAAILVGGAVVYARNRK